MSADGLGPCRIDRDPPLLVTLQLALAHATVLGSADGTSQPDGLAPLGQIQVA